MNTANDIERKITDAKIQERAKAEGRDLPLDEQYENSLITFEEERTKFKNKEEQLISKVLKRDTDNIQLKNKIEELERNYRLLENRHFSGIKKEMTEENLQAETNPEKIIQNTFMKVVDKQADGVAHMLNQKTYWIV